MEDVAAKLTALESENQSLKDVIERLDAQTAALDQTVKELLGANIGFKTSCSLLENRVSKYEADIRGLNTIIEGLKSENSAKVPPRDPDESLTE